MQQHGVLLPQIYNMQLSSPLPPTHPTLTNLGSEAPLTVELVMACHQMGHVQ